MHGDGLGMSVGEAVEEHYFSPTNNSPAAGSGANGSPAAGGTLQANCHTHSLTHSLRHCTYQHEHI